MELEVYQHPSLFELLFFLKIMLSLPITIYFDLLNSKYTVTHPKPVNVSLRIGLMTVFQKSIGKTDTRAIIEGTVLFKVLLEYLPSVCS